MGGFGAAGVGSQQIWGGEGVSMLSAVEDRPLHFHGASGAHSLPQVKNRKKKLKQLKNEKRKRNSGVMLATARMRAV
jgi:hypothetical protein